MIKLDCLIKNFGTAVTCMIATAAYSLNTDKKHKLKHNSIILTSNGSTC